MPRRVAPGLLIILSSAVLLAAATPAQAVINGAPSPRKLKRHARRTTESEVSSGSLFANWFAPQAEERKLKRRKQAGR